jgi:hypothetical protein
VLNPLKMMYQDTLSVSRLTGQKQPNGSTRQVLAAVTGLQGLPCRLSASKRDTPTDQKADINPVSIVYTLFCSDEHNILPGDTVTVTHHGRTDSFIAGQAMVYVSHQEILLQRKGEA